MQNYLNQLEGLSQVVEAEAAECAKISEEIYDSIVSKLAILFEIEFTERNCLDNTAVVSTSIVEVAIHYLTAVYGSIVDAETDEELIDFSKALHAFVFDYLRASLEKKASLVS